jgi:hypothetical protein
MCSYPEIKNILYFIENNILWSLIMKLNKLKEYTEDIFELETDNFGQVITQEDLIQIKIRKTINDIRETIGTLTFRHNQYDFSYNGILNKNNSEIFFGIWVNTGISRFNLISMKNRLFYRVDYLYYLYDFTEQVDYYHQFIKDYQEYDLTRLKP